MLPEVLRSDFTHRVSTATILSAVGSAVYLSFDSLTLYNLILSHLVKFTHSLSHMAKFNKDGNLPFVDEEEEDQTDATLVSYPTHLSYFIPLTLLLQQNDSTIGDEKESKVSPAADKVILVSPVVAPNMNREMKVEVKKSPTIAAQVPGEIILSELSPSDE